MRKLLMFALAATAAAAAGAQTVTVSASHLGGLNPVTGSISFQPVLPTGEHASFRLPTGGQQSAEPIKAIVTAGAFTVQIPDVAVGNPQGICYTVTALRGASTLVLGAGYSCVQPHATATDPSDWCQNGVCNFDNYVPVLPPSSTPPALPAPPDVMTFWNSLVATNGPATTATLTDANNITYSASNPNLNIAVLNMFTPGNCIFGCAAIPSPITSRTINVTGLVAGARFTLIFNPPGKVAENITFGTGCTWQFSPSNVAVISNVLVIPKWANWSYVASFIYDGTNCIGTVTN